jgi:hypothetical protein
MANLFYKPLGIILGVLAGRLAGKLFKQFWELAARESSSPRRWTVTATGAKSSPPR